MKEIANELESIISIYAERLEEIAESEFSAKPIANKWSKKEVIGHLIDSAENNLRRFICGQYEVPSPKIKYDQNFWVAANQYQSAGSLDVIQNWRFINLKICSVLRNMVPTNYSKTCDFGEGKLLTLEWLAADYVKHLKHHLNQVIPHSFDIVYP